MPECRSCKEEIFVSRHQRPEQRQPSPVIFNAQPDYRYVPVNEHGQVSSVATAKGWTVAWVYGLHSETCANKPGAAPGAAANVSDEDLAKTESAHHGETEGPTRLPVLPAERQANPESEKRRRKRGFR